MLQSLHSSTAQIDQWPTLVSGRYLKQFGKRLKPSLRAVLAAEISEGCDFTAAQLRSLVGEVSASYLCTAKKLTPRQRTAIHTGTLTLSAVHHAYRSPDRIIDRVIKKYGAEQVFAGLDRATAPAIAAE